MDCQVSEDEDQIKKRKKAHDIVDNFPIDQAAGKKDLGALNVDSDLEIEENDGQVVGGSGSEKGDIV